MQDGDRPGAAGEQLLGMLAAGAGPFPYRTGVHRLLGIPPRAGAGVRPPRAPFPADLPYETRAAFDPAVTAGPEAAGLLSSPPPIPIRGARPLASQPAPPAAPATRRDPSPSPTADPSRSSTAGPASSSIAPAPVPAAEPARRDEAPAKTIGLSIPGMTPRETIPPSRPARGGDAKPLADAAPAPQPENVRPVAAMPPRESRDPGEPAGPGGFDGSGGSGAPRIVSRRASVEEIGEEPVRLRARASSGGVAQVEAVRAATMERAARRAADDPSPAASAPESARPAPAAPPQPRVIVVREAEPARFTAEPFWSSSTLRGIHLGVLR